MENRVINLAVVAEIAEALKNYNDKMVFVGVDIVNEINQTVESIRLFIIDQLKIIIEKGLLDEVLIAHIHPLMIDERMPIVEEKLTQIVEN